MVAEPANVRIGWKADIVGGDPSPLSKIAAPLDRTLEKSCLRKTTWLRGESWSYLDLSITY
jgi:hypothetical protein